MATSFEHFVVDEPNAQFPLAANRYILYCAHTCPWVHGALLARAINGLESAIPIAVTHPVLGDGWRFVPESEYPGCIPDPCNAKMVKDIYLSVDPEYKGRFSVPVLFDKVTKKIVSNDSEDMINMFNTVFGKFARNPGALLPSAALQAKSDETFQWISTIIPYFYKTGMAETQQDYEENCKHLFAELDKVEAVLSKSTYLAGDSPTISDVRLFPFLYRLDPVYSPLFKCNLKTVGREYPHILRWMRALYKLDGVAQACNMAHIKEGNYVNKNKNPSGIVALSNGPDLTL